MLSSGVMRIVSKGRKETVLRVAVWYRKEGGTGDHSRLPALVVRFHKLRLCTLQKHFENLCQLSCSVEEKTPASTFLVTDQLPICKRDKWRHARGMDC